MATENGPCEDVFPIEHQRFPACHVSSPKAQRQQTPLAAIPDSTGGFVGILIFACHNSYITG